MDTSAIATRTRAKTQATEAPGPSKTQELGRSKEFSLAEDDDSDDEQSDPPIFRQRRSTLPNLGFHPKQMVENPRIPDSQGAVADTELREKGGESEVDRAIAINLPEIHDSDTGDQNKQKSTIIDLEELQESLNRFEKSLLDKSAQLQELEEEVVLLDTLSEGDTLDETRQEILRDLDPYDDDTGDEELNRRIEKLLQQARDSEKDSQILNPRREETASKAPELKNIPEESELEITATGVPDSTIVNRPRYSSTLPTPTVDPSPIALSTPFPNPTADRTPKEGGREPIAEKSTPRQLFPQNSNSSSIYIPDADCIPPDMESEFRSMQYKSKDIVTSTRQNLTYYRSNYVHFISSDCELVTPVSILLSDLGIINVNDLKAAKPRVGQILITKRGKNRIFSVVIKRKHFDKISTRDLERGLQNLRKILSDLDIKGLRISQNGDFTDELPQGTLIEILRNTFEDSNIEIALCYGNTQVPPEELRLKIISQLHESLVGGHKGLTKTYCRIRERFYWPGMRNDIQNYIRTCNSCQNQKLVRTKTREPMLITDTPLEPFSKVSIDTVGENYNEAINCNDGEKWREAMNKEIECLNKNDTWKLVEIPKDKRILDLKWVYTKKANNKFKARIVVRGFQQREVLDDIYSPVARTQTLKVLLNYCIQHEFAINQMDVESAFLNGKVKSEVYVRQPQGYDDNTGKVCKLEKALYGLRESPRAWYECLDEYLRVLGFKRSKIDYCLYFMESKNDKVYLIIFVDDLLICSNNKKLIELIKRKLAVKFSMKDMGQIKTYLGINIEYDCEKKIMKLDQKDYIESLANKYGIQDAKLYATPMEQNLKCEPALSVSNDIKYGNLIGALLYISSSTRPDICYCVNYLSRFQRSYDQSHYKYALRILKYLYYTKDLKLKFERNVTSDILDCCVDADWAGDIVDRKSTTGYVIRMYGNTIYWKSKKQDIVTKSSTEAEYVALSVCVSEIKLIRDLLKDFGIEIKNQIRIYEDNNGAISISV